MKMISATLTLLLLPATAMADAPTIKRTWPQVGHWTTMLAIGTDGRPACSTASPTSSGTLFNIILTDSATHLYLGYGSRDLPLPRTLVILADGQEIFAAPVINGGSNPSGHFVVADLPGRTLAETIAPALGKSNTMQIDMGERRFAVDTRHFSQVVEQLKDCAKSSP